MAIIIDENTRVVVQGLTGREGRFHALRNREYGTKVVAGVTPGKGGTDVEGIPVFDTMVDSIIFVPARFTADAVYEAADSGVNVIVCITEGVPAHDEARFVNYVHKAYPGTVLIGPNCPGLISPGKCNIGIMPGEITLAGGPVGLVSRSGTLTYQAVHELTQRGIGQTTCVGIGGDPVPGTGFIDCLSRFEADPATLACVMIGEIGGSDEETAAAYIASEMTKPVVAYVAGVTAPPGKKMGHAGAIVSGSKGTAAAKIEALEKAGCRVGRNPSEIGELMAEVLKGV
jgi:succinyl-CoA synthetase alpha subunit